MLSSIPSPSTNSISIGPLSLNAYGLMIALGVVAAIWLLGRQLESKGLGDSDDASSIGIWGVAAGIVGARLYHVATDFDRFSDNLGAIPKIWEGGLGIPGGLLAGALVGVWQGRRRGIAPAELLTCAAPAIPLAQAIGRWGNWFNQELFGKPTELPWGLEVDDAHTPAGYASDTLFHPTFLYESLWNLGLCGVLLWIDRKFRLGPGRLFAVYVMGYGIGRLWIEGLRIDDVQLDDVAGLRWNQWVALAAIVGGAVYLLATHGQKWPEPVVAAGAAAVDGVEVDGVEVGGVEVDGVGVDDVEVGGVEVGGAEVGDPGIEPVNRDDRADREAPQGEDEPADQPDVDDGPGVGRAAATDENPD